ncbi:hypothetical protein PRIPAC_83725, partial [Pristionchus pacificus]|uniref:Short-chain dehydrogenase/reductase 3 n=1 Tax=Pristionchus pacificus TaxID=54126 RepID=A0A2A6BNS9_PRIPA
DCFCAFFSNIAPIGYCKYKDITGQIVLITGAANGLGRLVAIRLATKGATLVLWDRDEKGLATTKEECEKSEGCKVKVYTVDMLNRQSIAQAADTVKREIGPVNLLINNAGIGIGGKLMEVAEDDIRKTIDLNMMSHFWMAREFLPEMLARDAGHIATVASMGGIFVSAQDMIPYCASKFGAMAIQEGLENEAASMGKHGVRFTTVCPAYFQSTLLDNLTTKLSMSVMTPEYVADATVDAILREMRIVMIPRTMYLMYAIKG